MKKLLTLLTAMLLCAVIAAGCGGKEEPETEKETERKEETAKAETGDLYGERELKTVACDEVVFQIPATIIIEADGEWTYYYYGNSYFALNVTDAGDLNNEDLIANKDMYIEGMTKGGGTVISDAVVELSGEKAIELVMTQEAGGIEYQVYSLCFAYGSTRYSLAWMIEKDSDIDPLTTYETFLKTVAMEAHEETDAYGDPTSWKLLSDLKKKNSNLQHITVYNEDTDPNKIMGEAGAYITKADFSDSRVIRTEEGLAGGTIETFLTEEDCRARAENLESQKDPDMGVLQLKQYIYQHGKILFRVSMDLPEIFAEEYDKQLEELLLEYDGKLNSEEETETGEEPEETETAEETEAAGETEEVEETEEAETASSSPTTGERNALSSAKQYLSIMPFSYTGLIEQLEFEQYSHEEAVYAADNCNADWNEQAAKSAKKYLDIMSFSRNGLIEQLEYEGYTHEEAVYGVEQNGY